MSVDLLPCPFCGAAATLVHGATDDYQVVCRGRGCFGPVTSSYAFSSDAIAAWNRRAATSPAGDLVDRLEATAADTRHSITPAVRALLREAAQALRYQSTGVTGEWRTMDSAPKDGTRFLAYGSYDYPDDAAPTEYFEVAAYSGDDEWPWETGEGLHKVEFFSHWQPITHPTAALTAQERG